MVFRTWAHERMPLNLQWPVLKNGGADFHLVGLLIICTENVIGV